MSQGERGADAFLKKIFVRADAVKREQADADLGFGIVEADAEKALAMVFHLNHVPVGTEGVSWSATMSS